MTQHFRVVWSKLALEDWHRLPAAVQGLIARAVERFPAEGISVVRGPRKLPVALTADDESYFWSAR
jgi:hypothetical protein